MSHTAVPALKLEQSSLSQHNTALDSKQLKKHIRLSLNLLCISMTSKQQQQKEYFDNYYYNFFIFLCKDKQHLLHPDCFLNFLVFGLVLQIPPQIRESAVIELLGGGKNRKTSGRLEIELYKRVAGCILKKEK